MSKSKKEKIVRMLQLSKKINDYPNFIDNYSELADLCETVKEKKIVWQKCIDNNSDDGSVEYLRERFPQAEVIANNYNAGFGKANNIAFFIDIF